MTLLNTMKPLNVFIVPKIYHISAVVCLLEICILWRY